MNIDYTTLTEEQVEEFVEFIDWTLVPSHLLTNNTKKFAPIFKKLKLRIWLEKKFENVYKIQRDGKIYFIFRDNRVMVLDTQTKELEVSSDLWKLIRMF